MDRKYWRPIGLAIVAGLGVLLVAGPTFSQREPGKPDQPPGGKPKLVIDRTPPPVTYTNFVQVAITPEELVLDLGLNTQVVPNPDQPVRIANRVVMNYYTAKRLALALQHVIKQHEDTYGPIELDFRKRVRPGGKGAVEK